LIGVDERSGKRENYSPRGTPDFTEPIINTILNMDILYHLC
jgi:hypothetical protein